MLIGKKTINYEKITTFNTYIVKLGSCKTQIYERKFQILRCNASGGIKINYNHMCSNPLQTKCIKQTPDMHRK